MLHGRHEVGRICPCHFLTEKISVCVFACLQVLLVAGGLGKAAAGVDQRRSKQHRLSLSGVPRGPTQPGKNSHLHTHYLLCVHQWEFNLRRNRKLYVSSFPYLWLPETALQLSVGEFGRTGRRRHGSGERGLQGTG